MPIIGTVVILTIEYRRRIMKQKPDGLNFSFLMQTSLVKAAGIKNYQQSNRVGHIQRTTCELCWSAPFTIHEVLAVGHVVCSIWGLIENAQSWFPPQKLQSQSLHFNQFPSWFLSAIQHEEHWARSQGLCGPALLSSPLMTAEEGPLASSWSTKPQPTNLCPRK